MKCGSSSLLSPQRNSPPNTFSCSLPIWYFCWGDKVRLK